MSHMTSGFGPGSRGVLFSMLVLAAAAFSWHAPQAGAQVQAQLPVAGYFPQSLDFGDVQTGGTSPVQTISLRNTGAGPMAISSILPIGGDYALTHDCPLAPSALSAGTYCTIAVSFAPGQAGIQSGVVQVAADTLAGAQEIALQGNGVSAPPKLLKSARIVTFPDTTIYTTSGPMEVLFTNNDPEFDIYPMELQYLPYGSDFTSYYPETSPVFGVAPGAGSPKAGPATKVAGPSSAMASCYSYLDSMGLAPGESCVAYVYFTPSALGLRTGQLVFGFYDGDFYFTETVLLRGNGVSVDNPGISLSTDQLDFGGVLVGQSASRTLSVSSTGTVPLFVTGVTTPGPGIFSATTDCDVFLPVGSSCTVTVTCTPDGLRKIDGDLYVLNSAPPGYAYVRLVCTGIEVPKPKIEVAATGVGFGTQSLGSTSAGQDILIKSVGSAPLAISNVAALSPFAATNNCPASLDPGLSCIATVTFTPVAAARQSGSLAISSNDPDDPTVTVDLSGTGCRPFSIQAARRGMSLCGP